MTETERLVREFKRRGGKVKRIRMGVGGLAVKTKSFYFRSFARDRTLSAVIEAKSFVAQHAGGSSVGPKDHSGHRAIPVDIAMAEGRFV